MLLMGNDISKFSIFLAFLLMLFIMACFPLISISANEAAGKKEVKQQKNPYASAKISIKIIPSVRKTFGFAIYKNALNFSVSQMTAGRPLLKQFR